MAWPPWPAILATWLAAFLVGTLVIYGLIPYQKGYDLVASVWERAIYGGFHRLAWSLALSWVILACVKGAGGPANAILSWAAWIPLARMSYCIYLIHMTVMNVVDSYASYRIDLSQVKYLQTIPHTQVLIIYYLIFVLAICIAVSYALIVLFEVIIEELIYFDDP